MLSAAEQLLRACRPGGMDGVTAAFVLLALVTVDNALALLLEQGELVVALVGLVGTLGKWLRIKEASEDWTGVPQAMLLSAARAWQTQRHDCVASQVDNVADGLESKQPQPHSSTLGGGNPPALESQPSLISSDTAHVQDDASKLKDQFISDMTTIVYLCAVCLEAGASLLSMMQSERVAGDVADTTPPAPTAAGTAAAASACKAAGSRAVAVADMLQTTAGVEGPGLEAVLSATHGHDRRQCTSASECCTSDTMEAHEAGANVSQQARHGTQQQEQLRRQWQQEGQRQQLLALVAVVTCRVGGPTARLLDKLASMQDGSMELLLDAQTMLARSAHRICTRQAPALCGCLEAALLPTEQLPVISSESRAQDVQQQCPEDLQCQERQQGLEEQQQCQQEQLVSGDAWY